MFFSTYSKLSVRRTEEQGQEQERSQDVDNTVLHNQNLGMRQSSVVDPIAHRPPGRFGHRTYSPSDVSHSESSITHPFRPPSLSEPSSHSPVIPPSPHAYSHTIPAQASSSHAFPFASSGDDMRDRWGNRVTYNYSLGSGPLSSPAELAQWEASQRNRRLNTHQPPAASRTPQIFITPESESQSNTEKQYHPPPSSPHFMRGSDNVGIEQPSSSQHPRFPTSPSLSAQSYQWKGAHDTCPFSMCDGPCNHRATSSDSSVPSNDSTVTRMGRAVPTLHLPKLQTSSLEFRNRAPSSSSSSQSATNSWGAPSASPLLSPPERHTGPSRLPLSPHSQASPHSSTSSSLTSSSPSTSPVTFVTFNPAEEISGAHIITEDKSLTDVEMDNFFPLSSQGPMEVTSKKGTPCRKWTCQFCNRSIRRQDRISHALEHQGKKRYVCNCGASFARSQDKKRHLREQAICRNCDRSVGRNGWRGICPSCSPRDRRDRDADFSSVSEASG